MPATRTKDAAPAYNKLDRIETYKRVIDRKKAEIIHLEDQKRNLTSELYESRKYLRVLKAELAQIKREK